MAASDRDIEEQKKTQSILRDNDVREIYLCEKNYVEKDICRMSRFKNLRKLWLTGNKLRRIPFLELNYRLSELYVNHNMLLDITGALSHLTSLEILHLHNNQLTKLEKVIKEFKKMQNLKVLNLFDNPCAKETDYRYYVIYHLPSVQLLDRAEVTHKERAQARRIYDQENEAIRDTVAFLRRTDGPPSLFHKGVISQTCTVLDDTEIGNNFYRNSPNYENLKDAATARHMKHSKMEITRFDWSKVPRAEERRLAEEPFDSPQVITLQFR